MEHFPIFGAVTAAAARYPLSEPSLYARSAFGAALLEELGARHSLETISAIILFGSAGRLEPARDIDLIFILNVPQIKQHSYHRVDIGQMHADINICSEGWLSVCNFFLEWEFWVTDGFVLYQKSQTFTTAIKRVRQRAFLKKSRAIKAKDVISLGSKLLDVAVLLRGNDFPRLRALCVHEAFRCAAFSTIHMLGEKNFSHRMLIEEFH